MKLLSVALGVALVLLGVRVLIGTGQRHDCGAPGGAAFMLSVQALGAAPSVTECLSLALTAPASPTTPPDPYEAARAACWKEGQPGQPPGLYAACMRRHGDPLPPATTSPAPPPAEPAPTVPYEQAERDCDQQLGLKPDQPLPAGDNRLQAFADCMHDLGHWVPVD
jgi:hypothetical protein